MPDFFSEPFLVLAGLSHKSALIAWGAFYFRVKGTEGDFKLVDDGSLKNVHPPRHESIGARSEPYGQARVEVFDKTGSFQRRDWVIDGEKSGLRPGRRYDNRFRTHPDPTRPAAGPLNFAVIGDFGTGVKKPSKSDRRQREVAAALEKAVDRDGVRLILTTGDNIFRDEPPKKFAEAHTRSWCAACHFLLVTIDGGKMTVRLLGEKGGTPQPLARATPAGPKIEAPIEVTL
jgi:tartrate-resistant acid phosphatase type 5